MRQTTNNFYKSNLPKSMNNKDLFAMIPQCKNKHYSQLSKNDLQRIADKNDLFLFIFIRQSKYIKNRLIKIEINS